jgi:hypothetical protein
MSTSTIEEQETIQVPELAKKPEPAKKVHVRHRRPTSRP